MKKRLLLLLCLCLMVCPQACRSATVDKKGAQVPRYFIFRTEPPGAKVYRIYDNGERLLVGFSGKPIPLLRDDLREGQGFAFSFELQGFLEEQRLLGRDDLLAYDSFPPPGQPPLHFPSPYRQIMFRTLPSGADIYLVRYSSPGGEDHIGASGKPLSLDLAQFLPDQEAELIFRLKGFHSERIRLKPHMFRPFSPEKICAWPATGSSPLTLRPASFTTACGLWLARNSATLVALFVILLSGGIFMGLKGAAMRRERMKWKDWEALKADIDQADPMFNRALGGYVMLEKIGEGGMAVVYAAVPGAGRRKEDMVAIKILKVKKEEEGEFFRRFRREVNVLRDLSHPNILRVIDYGEEEGLLYIVTEFIKGKTIERIIPPGGLDLEAFEKIFSTLCEAFAYAHGRGVVHRDVKGENIMVTEGGRIVIMDFGMAKGHQYSAITVEGQILGTPHYMAPEQVQKRELDSRTDQYSLGVLAFRMLTGRLPFIDESPFKVIYMHLQDAPPLPREFRPEIPESLQAMVLKMMEKEPENRFAHPGEIIEALKKALAAGTRE
jgi:hypothetical protein